MYDSDWLPKLSRFGLGYFGYFRLPGFVSHVFMKVVRGYFRLRVTLNVIIGNALL